MKASSVGKQVARPWRWILDNGCLFLTISLTLFLVVYPFLPEFEPGQKAPPALRVLFWFVMATAIIALHDKRWKLIVGGILWLVASSNEWIGESAIHSTERVTLMHGIAAASSLLFSTFVLFMVLGYVLRGGTVTRDKLFGAISLYLLLGYTFAVAYLALENFDSTNHFVDNFAGPDDTGFDWYKSMYFSFVTLTTLGYGDISPRTPQSRALANLEAVMGVLLVAVLVARIVGSYQEERKEEEAAERHESG